MGKIVTFGEIMLRLAPNGYNRFFQDDQLQATFGGGEANVAVSLANYGMHAAFVTRLPAHAIGQGAVNALRGLGVDASHIVRGGERVGIYYLEKGASQRGSVCIYDRAHSAIQQARPEEFDWDSIFEDAVWFHFTGITPALGGALPEICLDVFPSGHVAAFGLQLPEDVFMLLGPDADGVSVHSIFHGTTCPFFVSGLYCKPVWRRKSREEQTETELFL